MGGFIFTIVVTCIACAISYYYLHIHPDGVYTKNKDPEPKEDNYDVNNFWK
ncbi:hypothetical protein CPT_Munch_527 [Salmonella phage Munch]|nr:hypothetical protein CPT_Munch_527 [Salmonella phage Munch]